MTVNTQDTQTNLRVQMINAMAKRLGSRPLAESVFDCELWPVLVSAMGAGDLLLHRNTGPEQKPVHEAITGWLEVVGWTVARVKNNEHTISKAQLIKLLYDLDDSCKVALADAKSVQRL